LRADLHLFFSSAGLWSTQEARPSRIPASHAGARRRQCDQSNLALDLAQTRYQPGLSGIVERSQAQLAQTQGEIAYANARYAHQTALAELRFQTGQSPA
jgi:outer membrane protein